METVSATWIWLGRDISRTIGDWGREIEEEGVNFRKQVEEGDRIIWWKSGKFAGIYGLGKVAGPPYAAGFTGWHKREYRFSATVDHVYSDAPLFKVDLDRVKGLRPLLKRLALQRPNLRPVTQEQWKLIHNELGKPRRQVEVISKAGGGFGEPQSNRRVEKEAVDYVKRRLKRTGWTVSSVESERCGFDLTCAKEDKLMHLEVKGISGLGHTFIFTAKERAAAEHDSLFHLALVTSATSTKLKLSLMTGRQALLRFHILPLSYSCRPKRAVTY